MQETNGCIIVSGGSKGLGIKIVEHCLEQGQLVAFTCARSSSDEFEQIKV